MNAHKTLCSIVFSIQVIGQMPALQKLGRDWCCCSQPRMDSGKSGQLPGHTYDQVQHMLEPHSLARIVTVIVVIIVLGLVITLIVKLTTVTTIDTTVVSNATATGSA